MTGFRALGAFIAMMAAQSALIDAAQAAVITQKFNVIASGFFGLLDATATPPVDPVVGVFTLTYDNAVSVTDSSAGLVVNNLNIMVDSQVDYSYNSESRIFGFGGLADGINGSRPGNDFGLSFGLSGNVFNGGALSYYQGTEPFLSDSLSVTVTDVPEPAGWAMLVTGFGLVGATLRRRRIAIVAA